MSHLLEIQNLQVTFGGLDALSGLNFHVDEGEIVSVIGPNGAGKTTLMKIINQITAPDSGLVFFNNEILQRSHISKIGYLPEERGLYKKMKVGEQCLYLSLIHI